MKLKLKFLVSQALNSLLWFLTKTRQEKVLFFFSNVCSGFPTQHVNWKSYKETGLLKKSGRDGNRETATDKNLLRSAHTRLRNSYVTVCEIQHPEHLGGWVNVRADRGFSFSKFLTVPCLNGVGVASGKTPTSKSSRKDKSPQNNHTRQWESNTFSNSSCFLLFPRDI